MEAALCKTQVEEGGGWFLESSSDFCFLLMQTVAEISLLGSKLRIKLKLVVASLPFPPEQMIRPTSEISPQGEKKNY